MNGEYDDEEIINHHAAGLRHALARWRKRHGTISEYDEIIQSWVNSAYYSGRIHKKEWEQI